MAILQRFEKVVSPVDSYINSLAPMSQRAVRSDLKTVSMMLTDQSDARQTPWAELRYVHVSELRNALAERYAPASANRMLASVRGVLREAWRLGLMSAEDLHQTVDFKPVRGTRLPAGRALTKPELKKLVRKSSAVETLAGRRDAALVAVLYGAGLRRSEAVALDRSDVHVKDATVRVRAGKGNRERLVPLSRPAMDLVANWLACHEHEAVFVRVRRGDNLTGERLTDQSVRLILEKLREQLGMESFAPHDLRRSALTRMLELTGDLSATQQFAGHADPKTTTTYDRRGPKAVKKASQLLGDVF